MIVAVNRSASIFPVINRTGRFCLNLMSEDHAGLLECFSRSDMRERRFAPEHWVEGLGGLPTMRGALSVHVCTVADRA